MSEIRVAAVQTSPDFGEKEENLERALALIPAGCDLAVLPELCTTGYQFRSREEALGLAEEIPSGAACARLREYAADSGTTVVAGLVERAGGEVYNSCVLVRPDGGHALYRKVHLFWDEKTVFAPGDLGFAVERACGAPVGMMICFDWIFPESARTLALAGAAVLLHPSNLVLPHCPSAMPIRCIENRVFAVTANRVGTENRTGTPLRFIGLSRVIGPDGAVLAACDGESEGAAAAAIDPAQALDKQATPRNNLWEDRRTEFYRL